MRYRIITIITMLLTMCIGSAFVHAEQTQWKTLKPAGAEVTAIAKFDGGLARLIGDSQGDIYMVNRSGCKKLNVHAAGKIDSIVITRGGNDLGDFSYSADGRVYTYYTKNDTQKPLNLNPAVNAKLSYSIDSGLYCSAESSDANALTTYHYTGNPGSAWKKVADDNSNLFLKGKENKIDSGFFNNNSVLQEQPENSNGIFKIDSDGKVQAEPTVKADTMDVKVYYVSSAVGNSNDAIYRVVIKGAGVDQTDFSKDKGGYNGFYYNVNYYGTYNAKEYPITPARYIEGQYAHTAAINPGTISFLWEGPKITKNEARCYLYVDEYLQKVSGKTDKNVDSYHVKLPVAPATEWQPPANYTISITYAPVQYVPSSKQSANTVYDYKNSVCATPFRVTIEDSNYHPLTPSGDPNDYSDPYNHLVFYIEDASSKKPITNDLVGCNTYCPDTSNNIEDEKNQPTTVAVLPDDCVEIDGKVKYGTKYAFANTTGKTFYLFSGAQALSQNIWVGFASDTDTSHGGQLSVTPLDLPVIKTDQDTQTPWTLLDQTGGRIFNLLEQVQGISVSNWEGDSSGNYRGYINYIIPTDNHSFQGNYALIPQGLNTRPMFPDYTKSTDSRLDPSDMQAGYYFEPNGGTDDGLHSDNYCINDMTSYCDALRGKTLHGYLFDQYGNYADYQVTDQNTYAEYLWHHIKPDDSQRRTLIRLTNWSNVPICIHGQSSDKNKELSGISNYDKGVFIPPDPSHASKGIDFMTDYQSNAVPEAPLSFYLFGNAMIKGNNTDYDYFKATITFDTVDKSQDQLAINTKVTVSDSMKEYAEKNNNDKNMYLPLIQPLIYGKLNDSVKLINVGVHFIEWDRACYAADHTCVRYGSDYNGEYAWLYGQQSFLDIYEDNGLVPAYVSSKPEASYSKPVSANLQDVSGLQIYTAK